MGDKTKIHWTHSTVNPVMGCDGCTMWPQALQLQTILLGVLAQHGIRLTSDAVKKAWDLHADSNRLSQALHTAVDLGNLAEPSARKALHTALEERMRNSMRCYAGILSRRFHGASGYAASFDAPEKFPGRILKAAKWAQPSLQEEIEKPWLAGSRRLIFVSDMGDVLSKSISFDYLHAEIIAPIVHAESEHVWLWLTKRPGRMVEFFRWLEKEGVSWPKNLVPMTSILNQGYVRSALSLLEIPSEVRGFSLEPLEEKVELPAEMLSSQSWLIVGGESGSGAKTRPFALEHARDIRDRAMQNGAHFFLKQLGAHPTLNGIPFPIGDSHGAEWMQWPADLRVREIPPSFYRG